MSREEMIKGAPYPIIGAYKDSESVKWRVRCMAFTYAFGEPVIVWGEISKELYSRQFLGQMKDQVREMVKEKIKQKQSCS